MLFFEASYLSKNPEKKSRSFHKNIKQNNCFQHVSVISEGLCDTED